jgi:hypothetical protein
MAEKFNPYYSWLAIPPEEQPADYYRLLGVRRFESNAEVISNASDQRLSHIRTFQAGQYANAAQRLLNEISTATRCLLNPELKQKYDTKLQAYYNGQASVKKSAAVAQPAAPASVAQTVSQVVPAPTVRAKQAPTVAHAPAVAQPVSVPLQPALAAPAGISQVVLGVLGLFVGISLVAVSAFLYFFVFATTKPAPQGVEPANALAQAESNASEASQSATSPATTNGTQPAGNSTTNQATTSPTGEPVPPRRMLPKPDLLRPIPVGSVWKFMDSKPGWFNTFHKISERKWIYKDDDGLEFEMEELGSNEQGISIKDWSQVNTFPVVFNDEQCTFTSVRTGRRVLKGGWVLDANDAETILAEFTASRASSRPPDTMIEYKERGDVIFAVNHRWGGKILLESPTPLFMEGQPCTLEYWFRRQDSPRSSIPFLRMGDVNVFLAHRGADSGGELSLSTRAGGGGSYVPLIEEWHHVIVQMDENNWIQAWLDTRRGQFPARSFSPFQDIKTYQPVEIGPGFRQKGDEFFLQGEIRSLRYVRQALHKEKRPVALAYNTFSHGIKLPHDVVLKLVNVDIKKPFNNPAALANTEPVVNQGSQTTPMPIAKPVAVEPSTPEPVAAKPQVENSDPQVTFKAYQKYENYLYSNPPLAMPTEEEIAEAKQSLETVFGEDFKKNTKPTQKLELAARLQKSSETEPNAKLCYVLLTEAQRLSLEANELKFYFELLETLERKFPVDRLTSLAADFPKFSMLKLNVEAREKGSLEALRMARVALSREQFEIAKNFANLAGEYVKLSRDQDMKQYVRTGQEQLLAALEAYAPAKEAYQKWEASPHDAAANLTLAKFHGMICGNFSAANRFLLHCGDEKLAKAAKLEQEAEQDLAATEAWGECLADFKGYEKLALQEHLMELQQRLLLTSTGIVKDKLFQQYKDLRAEVVRSSKYSNPSTGNARSERPITGFIVRMFVGGSKNEKPQATPYIGVVENYNDIEKLNFSKHANLYNAAYRLKIIGYINVEKSQRVRVTLKRCTARIGTENKYDAESSSSVNTSVVLEAGQHQVMITSNSPNPEFQIIRSDTGENAVGYTNDLLETEIVYRADLPTGSSSTGIRIDK